MFLHNCLKSKETGCPAPFETPLLPRFGCRFIPMCGNGQEVDSCNRRRARHTAENQINMSSQMAPRRTTAKDLSVVLSKLQARLSVTATTDIIKVRPEIGDYLLFKRPVRLSRCSWIELHKHDTKLSEIRKSKGRSLLARHSMEKAIHAVNQTVDLFSK